MSRSRARSHAIGRHERSTGGKRSLRLEQLESRLVLSTGVAPQFVGPNTLAATSTVAVNPVADAFVSSISQQTNFGQLTDLLVRSDSSARGFSSDAYLKFDLSNVGTVSKAVLNLTPISVGSTSSVTFRIQLLKDTADGWVEGTGGTNRSMTGAITWANSPVGSGLIVTVSGSQLRSGVPISIDVTKLVQQTFNTNGIASFVVEMTPRGSGASLVDFASREYATLSYRPTLTVTSTGADPIVTGNAPTVMKQPAITSQTSTGVVLSVLGADKEDAESSLKYTWSVTSASGLKSPTFSVNGSNAAKNAAVTFYDAGVYVFTAKITDSSGLSVGTSSVTVTVGQVLTAVSISPASITLAVGGSQKFTAAGVDQFGDAMSITAGNVTWSATSGSFSGGTTGISATYVAPSSAATATVTAKCGSLTSTAAVSVVRSNFLGLIDPALASLTQSLVVDGSISRADMIAILRSVQNESDGIVDTQDMSDLKTILNNSTTLNIVNYALVLAKDVVFGSTANTYYLGTKLGNLAVGSSASTLDKLIGKWFYGTDLPATGGYSYDTNTAGTLYGTGTPSHTDEKQGALGTCYLLSSLGSIADSSAAAIKNMLIDNGDGTWTVRFYYNGTADYVTVNSQLPVGAGNTLIFDGYGSSSTSTSNVLWLPLIEKAYAQWNETGKTGRSDARNSYTSIEGGWMGDVFEQALGYSASTYYLSTSSSSAQQALINAVGAKQAVTIGTKSFGSDATTGLYGGHAYNVIAYNSSTGKFTLYNPWGSNQPAQLTWAQLKKYCDGFAATVATGSASASAALRASLSASLVTPVIVTSVTSADILKVPAAASVPSVKSNGRTTAVDAVFADAAHGREDSWEELGTTSWLSSDLLATNRVAWTAPGQGNVEWSAKIDSLFDI